MLKNPQAELQIEYHNPNNVPEFFKFKNKCVTINNVGTILDLRQEIQKLYSNILKEV